VPVILEPEIAQLCDSDVKIWRYMDFVKFVSLIDSKKLFLARSDKLGDAFEGSYPEANVIVREDTLNKNGFSDFVEITADIFKKIREYTFISCWHINQFESDAMWKLYSYSGQGIAIQSSYYRLLTSLNEASQNIFVGLVQYIDYSNYCAYGVNALGNALSPFFLKRKSFEHERELRAMIQETPIKDGAVDWNIAPPEWGEGIEVNLNVLIENIYICPTAPSWIVPLVESVLDKYKLNKEVKQSSLNGKPYY
jgi:hypothetical protein